MNIAEQTDGNTSILAITGRIDSTTAKQLEEVLPERMQNTLSLVLDLSGTQYVSSAGLRVILKTAKIAKSFEHRLILAGLEPSVLEVFQISGFTAIFDIRASREAALQSIVSKDRINASYRNA